MSDEACAVCAERHELAACPRWRAAAAVLDMHPDDALGPLVPHLVAVVERGQWSTYSPPEGNNRHTTLRDDLRAAGVPEEHAVVARRTPPLEDLQCGKWPPGLQPTPVLREVLHLMGVRWVIAGGAVGRGKSTAAACWLALQGRGRGRWVQSERIAQLPLDAQWGQAELGALELASALVIDELGVRDGVERWQGGAAVTVLAPQVQRVLACRYEARRPTFVTTNMAPLKVLGKRQGSLEAYLGDERLEDRLASRGRFVLADGANLRRGDG